MSIIMENNAENVSVIANIGLLPRLPLFNNTKFYFKMEVYLSL